MSHKFYGSLLLARVKQIGSKCYENRETGNVSPISLTWTLTLFCVVLSSSVNFRNIWLMSYPQAPVHYSLRLLTNLLGTSVPDALSSQSCGCLAVSKSLRAIRVAKGIPTTLPQWFQITEMIIETFLCETHFQGGSHYFQNSPDARADRKAIFFPFHLLYEMIFKQRTEACFIFEVLLGMVFRNHPPTQTQSNQVLNNHSNIQSSSGWCTYILSSIQSICV